ncbi:MAG: PAS domain-containing protein [Rhodospirillaceae bacterium]
MTRARRAAERYGVALLAVVGAIAARWVMDPLLGSGHPFATLYGAVAVAVWFGGGVPAAVTAVSSYLAANFLFVEPRGALAWSSAGDVAGMIAYALSCVLIIGFGEAMRRAREGAASYRMELVERQRRMGTILESISDAFYAVDNEWRFVYVNSQAERFFGHSKHELIGASIWSVFPEAAQSKLGGELRRAMSEQVPIAVEVHAPTVQHWVELRAYPSPDGLSVFFRDVQDRKEAEAALVVAKVEAEQRAEEVEKARNILQTMFEHVPEGIMLTGGPPHFPLIAHSRYGEQLLAKSRDELVGMPAGHHIDAWRVLLPDGRTRPAPEEMPLYRAAHHGELVKNVEFLMETADGTLVPVLVNAAPVRNKQGEIVGAINCWRDVSDAKIAYARIEAAQRRLQAVADSVPALISYVDRQFRYQLANRAYEEWLGIPSRAFEGRHVRDVLGEKAWETLKPHAERAVRGECASFETCTMFRDGTKHWLSVTYSPDIGADGMINGYVGHAMDITQSKRTQAALNRRNERLALLWEAAAVLLSTDEPRDMLHRLFRSIGPHLGLDTYLSFMTSESGDVLVLEACSGVPEEDRQRLQQLSVGNAVCGKVALQRKPRVVEDVQRATDADVGLLKSLGLKVYVCHPLIAGERLLGTLSFGSRTRTRLDGDELDFLRTVAHYVTLAYERLRLLGELRDADRRKDEFLSLLAHELRNPLAPVRNGLQLLRMPNAAPATLRKATDMMERQLSLMVRLIDDLLDVSRITRGKVELRLERVELKNIIMQGVETARPHMENKGQQITVTVPREPVWLDADPVRLAQVVSNLLNNACKFTERGGRIWVRAERRGNEAVIKVTDTGIGIPPEKLTSIFDMFVQADPSAARRHSGLGVGLTLVKSLVEMHHGTVNAHSEGANRGAEFTVVLPVSADQPAPETIKEKEHPYMASRRILVIDDSADSAESLGMLLTMMGHQVRTSLDGNEALQVADAFHPEVVMCDIGMPGMSGFELAPRLREQLGPDTRLVALTGYGSDEDRRRTQAAGFDAHLVKPVDMEALRGILAEPPRDGAARRSG